jgi:ACR3 family arsenite efflux pump ArsB
MMYPILCKVQYEKLHEVFKAKEIWVQMGFSIIINWIIAPLVMVSSFICPIFLGLVRDPGADYSSSAWPGHFYQTSKVSAKASS